MLSLKTRVRSIILTVAISLAAAAVMALPGTAQAGGSNFGSFPSSKFKSSKNFNSFSNFNQFNSFNQFGKSNQFNGKKSFFPPQHFHRHHKGNVIIIIR